MQRGDIYIANISPRSGSEQTGIRPVILCHQITTLDKSKLHKKISSLSEKQIKEVEKAIKYSLDIFY